MSSELISVIIPTYNRAEMLREAIESVLSQTYENFELLILDNCSPDHTPDVVASFNDARIKYLRHQCNIGAIANWAYGVHWAQGKYLSILGDDDKYKPEFLSRRVQAMTMAPNVVAAFGPFEFWYPEKGITKISQSLKMQSSHECILEGYKCLYAAINIQFVGASLYDTCSVRSVWNKVITGGQCGDSCLNALLGMNKNYSMIYLECSDLLYRCHANQDMQIGRYQVALDGGMVYTNLMQEAPDNRSRKIIKTALINHWNRYGRSCWESGDVLGARKYFLKEIAVSPFCLTTWGRIVRTYLNNEGRSK
jgi:Glycosyltransferases involved in cell wall biogenesis